MCSGAGICSACKGYPAAAIDAKIEGRGPNYMHFNNSMLEVKVKLRTAKSGDLEAVFL